MGKSSDSVVILAAGDGTRLKSELPKVFHKIGGLSLVDHVISSAKKIDPTEIVVVLKPGYGSGHLEFGVGVKIAHQMEPRGTGDAAKCGLRALLDNSDDGWVYVLYGDVPLVTPESLLKLAEVARTCEKTAAVLLAMVSNSSTDLGKLISVGEPGITAGVVEAKEASKYDNVTSLCNAGLLLKKKLLKEMIDEIKPSPVTGEYYITDLVRMVHEVGYVSRYLVGDGRELSGVNSMVDMAILEGYFQEKMRRWHMDNGVRLVAPETVFFCHDTIIEQDVIVHPYVVFLKNVRLKSGSRIGPFCVVEGAEVDNSQIGPFARLRPETEVHAGATVGNFVEVKNSIVGENVRVNHLSYIGDSCIGENSNIGAGTITCNYDGFHKHRTAIGRNVFVGSNSALVAPVVLGDDALIGAGSVVVKDVDAGDLVVARCRQRNIAGGAIAVKKSKSGK
ncbi:MAG: bifunctional UDP-N-acetylglucosamine diphosphorylase/glucosamine-1-phosphate N-acetyltransferase GlmU [Holosporaceae bacterium]|jgi:bifunctional UDP-N-acetylglucosamine pyrophosphorylase/glucosamine-1-phosphate N-acetyltransferase|nr:bifunctional UDP-N-acetylglucosamine diphosphorylase/glucosamine-1-phosphate N-acetyltransferase GlmU [Holosporaceae bacterium]